MPVDLSLHLNPEQRKAAECINGPLLILAGAGTGKTRTLTWRMASMVENHGISPDQILALTFTNKAADEMRTRLAAQLGARAQRLTVCTFHALCARICREFSFLIPRTPQFQIFDQSAQQAALRRALERLAMERGEVEVRSLLREIEQLKVESLGLDTASDPEDSNHASNPADLVQRASGAYQKILERADALDFSDLIVECVRLLRSDVAARERCQGRWQWIVVDEFQDTDRTQLECLILLAGEHQNICVVGDDDQSIYTWRGADVRNILHFEDHFPKATVVTLELNYRSTPEILDLAQAVIARARARRAKTLKPLLPSGVQPHYQVCNTERSEAEWVADEVSRAIRAGSDPREVAVLFRTHAQSRIFEEVFMGHAIQHHLVGGTRFFDRTEILDLVAWLRITIHPGDDEAFMRIVNVPARGIGQTSLRQLTLWAEKKNGLPLLEASRRGVAEHAFKKPVAAKWAKFHTLVDELRHELECATEAHILAEEVLRRTGYLDMLTANSTSESFSRYENLKEFISALKEFSNREGTLGAADGATPVQQLTEFFEAHALAGEVDSDWARSDRDGVSLMTLHAAKGLEFDTVFLTGMEEGVLPHLRSRSDEEGDHERRLCYVGLTRARRVLALSRAGLRRGFGEVRQNMPSRFLGDMELESRYVVERDGEEWAHADAFETETKYARIQAENAYGDFEAGEDVVGRMVIHETYGKGCVCGISGGGQMTRLHVDFPGVGTKKILAAFVRFA